MTQADQVNTKDFNSGLWLITTIALIALIVGLNLIFQWRMDVFGILRDAHGRSLVTSHHEPKAKFLLNTAYVPDNFNALIIGASASENWDLNAFTGYRFYNESIEGANASVERKLVEQALPGGHFKAAIVCMFPRITSSHGLFDGLDMTRPEEAYGSLNAYTIEGAVLKSRYTHEPLEASPNGSHQLPARPLKPFAGAIPEESIVEDPQAVSDYRATIKQLMDHGTKVVYVIYPLYQLYYERNAGQIASFEQAVKREYPTAPIINLNDPEYTAFRTDVRNWIDEVHLSERGAEIVSPIINSRFHEALSERP